MSDGLTFGRYQLLERVAAGGMGEVWVGLQTGIGKFQRPVAVKLLLPHLIDDERLVKMFLQEARLGAQMTHANVVQVYDVGFEVSVRRTPSTQLTIAALLRGDGDTRDVGSPST